MNSYLLDTRIEVQVGAHQKAVDSVLKDVMDKNQLTPEHFNGRFPKAIFAERKLHPDIWYLREYEIWISDGSLDGILAARFRVDIDGKIEYKP